MYATGADVADRSRNVTENFTLDIEIPLHHVIALRIRFHEGVFQSRLVNRINRSVRESELRQCTGAHDAEERRSSAIQRDRGIEQWEDVEDPEASAHRGLAAVKRIPGKANARLEIAQSGIGEVRGAQPRRRGVNGWEVRELSFILRYSSGHLVAEAQIHSQVGAHAPIILDISAQYGGPHVAGSDRAGNYTPHARRLVREKVGQLGKGKGANEIACGGERVHLIIFEGPTESYGM